MPLWKLLTSFGLKNLHSETGIITPVLRVMVRSGDTYEKIVQQFCCIVGAQ